MWVFWFMHTVISMFILLNVIVSIMGDSFNRVQSTAENNMWKEFAGIMVENERLMNRDTSFKNAKYIIVIKQEQADDEEDNWDG
jgi:hypothetical protein